MQAADQVWLTRLKVGLEAATGGLGFRRVPAFHGCIPRPNTRGAPNQVSYVWRCEFMRVHFQVSGSD